MRVILFIAAVLLMPPAWAGPVVTYEFASEAQEELFNKLSNELRCLVCQNQAISDSNADLAKDLRDEIYGMLQQGKSEAEIVDFMVARYGDFVLYRPQIKSSTYLLWFGPVLLLVIVLVVFVYRLRTAARPAEVDSGALANARNLLEEDEPKK